jgi:hypothetical protein
MWRFCDRPRRQLVSLPMTYFEVEEVRPDENQGQANLTAIFVSTPRGVSVPGELNQGILQFLTGKDLLRFVMVSKAAYQVVRYCWALLFVAVYEQIDDFVGQNGRQVNSHGFKKKNRVRVNVNGELVDGYCVRVTFERHPDIKRVKSKYGVEHVRPYIGIVVEVKQNWSVESCQG